MIFQVWSNFLPPPPDVCCDTLRRAETTKLWEASPHVKDKTAERCEVTVRANKWADVFRKFQEFRRRDWEWLHFDTDAYSKWNVFESCSVHCHSGFSKPSFTVQRTGNCDGEGTSNWSFDDEQQWQLCKLLTRTERITSLPVLANHYVQCHQEMQFQ